MRLFRSHFLVDPQSPHKSLVGLVRLKREGMALSRFVVCRDQGRNEIEDRIYGLKPGAKGKQGKREMRQRIEQEKRRKKKEQLRSLARWPCVAGPSLGPASPTPPPPFSSFPSRNLLVNSARRRLPRASLLPLRGRRRWWRRAPRLRSYLNDGEDSWCR